MIFDEEIIKVGGGGYPLFSYRLVAEETFYREYIKYCGLNV
jgi:hypothetical protein